MHNYETGSIGQGSSFVAGLLWGAAVGAALGLVFAPQAGAETRRTLAESGQKLREGARRKFDEASEGVSNAVAQGRQAMDRGRDAFERTRSELTDTIKEQTGGPAYSTSPSS